MNYLDLSDLQLDALKEIANIGTGNAATALSQLLNMKVNMKVPSINVVSFDDIFSHGRGEKVVISVLVRALGDIPGNILFVMEKDIAINMVNKALGKEEKEISEMGNSVLCEIGNILCSAYMNSIAKFTNLVIVPSVPAITYDMFGAILSTTFIESGQFNEYVLDIETLFGEKDEKINGHFYYIPMPGSLEKILNSIGIE